MGPQDPKDIARDIARDTVRDLSGLARELASQRADAHHQLTAPEYAALRLRLQNAHAPVGAALIEVRRGKPPTAAAAARIAKPIAPVRK